MIAIRVNKPKYLIPLAGAIACGIYVGNAVNKVPVYVAEPIALTISIPQVAVPLPPPRPKFEEQFRTKIKGDGKLPASMKPIFASSAQQVSLSPSLLAAVAYQESRFDAGVCSSAGACGVMQMMPAAAKDYKVTRRDAGSSIRGGAKMLSDLHRRYEGNTGVALAAYNWGPGNVNKWLKAGAKAERMPKETRDYVIQITGKDIDVWTGKTKTITQLLSKLNPADHLGTMMKIFGK